MTYTFDPLESIKAAFDSISSMLGPNGSSAIIQIGIAVLIFAAAWWLVEKISKKFFWLILSGGMYLFSRGLLTTDMVMGWLNKAPDVITGIVKKLFLLFD